MQKYYLEDEYNSNAKHQDACTCPQKYGKCSCEKPRKRKSSKRKNAEKNLFLQKQELVYLTPQKLNEGGCGGCGANVQRNVYEQRGCHSTPPPVLQPLTATPMLIAQQTSPLPPRAKDLPYYKEDVPTKEHAYVVDQQHPPKMYLKQSNYSTGQAQHTNQQGVMRSDGQDEAYRTRRDSPTQTKDPRLSQQKESLNVQFPCPCMSANMNGVKKADLWDLQFYKWWGWNWLKEREDILRKQMEKEGKRFSEEFPILMANYYAKEAAKGKEEQPQTNTQQVRNSQQLHQSQQKPPNQTDRQSDRYSQQLQHGQQQEFRPERNSQVTRQSQPFHDQEYRLQQDRNFQQFQQPQQYGRVEYLPQFQQQQRNQYPLHSCPLQQEYYRRQPNQEPQYAQQYRPQDLYLQPQQGQPQQQLIEVHGDCCKGPIEGVYSISRYPELKEKKWSFIRTINNAIKSMCKDKRPTDETGVCQCGANLNMCGPYNKPCRGLEGIIMPCGFECECGPDKKCLLPYLQDLCPCGKTCKCPRPHQATLLPQFQAVPVPAQEITRELPMAGRTNFVEDPCGCAAYAKQEQSSSSVSTGTLSHGAQKDHDQNCCCSCDEEMCPCCCCCFLDICQKNVQTSRFCLRENCTQTEVTPKKCCRCCRCCSSKGKKKCSMCMKNSNENLNNDNNNNGGNNGRGVYLFKTAQDPASSYYSTQDRLYLRPNSTSVGALNKQYYQTGNQYYYQRNNNGHRLTNEIPTNNIKRRAKTTIVKSNSIQCIPPKENKSTSCTYDDTITSETRFDQFMSQLYGTNIDINKQLFKNSSGVDFIREEKKASITLDANDINRLTKAKLRNYFLEGDVYSSPVSGRNYDLSYRTIEAPSRVTDTKLLKPLDVNDELQFAQLPSQWFASDHEHTKLMTAVCEAILSNNQENVEVEEPTKEIKAKEADKSVELVQEKVEGLQTIIEDNESLRSSTNDDKTVRSPSVDLNQNIIFEIQQNFKEKIEKLENKIDKLMITESGEVDQTKTKCRIRENSRSRSTSPKSQQKKIMEHKPLITKTGLFGVIPTRSQIFSNGSPRRPQEISLNAHQKGDAKPEEGQNHLDESISKYEDLVLTNQKRVDDLLVQLETLHTCNTLLDKSGIAEIVQQPPICCFEAKEELIYKPNLGIPQEPFQVSSDNLFGQLEDMLTGNAQGEKMFLMNGDQASNDSNLRPSTSSARETVFKKHNTTEEDDGDPDAKEHEVMKENFPIAAVSDQNFIVRNLPSFTTNITDSFAVEKILRRGNTAIAKTDSISSKEDSSDGCLSSSSVNSEVNLKNKE